MSQVRYPDRRAGRTVDSLLFPDPLVRHCGKLAADEAPGAGPRKEQYARARRLAPSPGDMPSISELWDPANDIPGFRRAARRSLRLPGRTSRSSWAGRATQRNAARYENIGRRDSKDLIARANCRMPRWSSALRPRRGAGLSSTHAGARAKANKLIFLPLDMKPWSDDQIPSSTPRTMSPAGSIGVGTAEGLRPDRLRTAVSSGQHGPRPGEERLRTVRPRRPGRSRQGPSRRRRSGRGANSRKTTAFSGQTSRGGPELLPARWNLPASEKGEGRRRGRSTLASRSRRPRDAHCREGRRHAGTTSACSSWTLTETLTQRQGEQTDLSGAAKAPGHPVPGKARLRAGRRRSSTATWTARSSASSAGRGGQPSGWNARTTGCW